MIPCDIGGGRRGGKAEREGGGRSKVDLNFTPRGERKEGEVEGYCRHFVCWDMSEMVTILKRSQI